MELDADGVCVVIHALCKAGHIDDAVMIHHRLQQGSLGLASPHRKSYLALLSHLCALSLCPFPRSVLSVFDEGMKGGWLRSPTAHRQKWVIDLRGLPSMVNARLHPLASARGTRCLHGGAGDKREGLRPSPAIPHRGLIVSLREEPEWRGQERTLTEALRSSLPSLQMQEGYHPHALSMSVHSTLMQMRRTRKEK